MNYQNYGFECECGSKSFYCNCQKYDGTHKEEDYAYSWANVPEHMRGGVVVIEPGGTFKPEGYRNPPNRWTTRKQRKENPEIADNVKKTTCQPCMYVSDPTWYTCSVCEKEVDANYANDLIEQSNKKHAGQPYRIYEEIGSVIINDYTISKLEINHPDL